LLKLSIDGTKEPTIVKQKMRVDEEVVGYLGVDKLHRPLLTGNYSLISKYASAMIVLNEVKKQDGKRNWIIELQGKVDRSGIGFMCMTSDTKTIFCQNSIRFDITYRDKHYYINRPFMQWNKDEAFLYNDENELVGRVIVSLKEQPSFSKVIYMKEPLHEIDIAFFIVVLCTALFVG